MGLAALNAEQEAQFQAWRAVAVEQMPYFARILFGLRVLNAPGLGTWAVDGGYRMYIDFDAVAPKGLRWNVESVLHEASHLFAEHKRSAHDLGVTEADADVWNVASDLSINDDLDAAGCTTFRSDRMLPEFINEPDGQTPHHYYGVLRKKIAEAQQAQNGRPSGAQSGQQPGQQPGQQSEQGGGSGGGDGDPSPQDGNGGGGEGQAAGPYKGCGSGSGGRAWDGELAPEDDMGGLAPAVGEVEHEAIRLATAAAIKDHVAKGRGTVPGGLVEIADKILEPSKTPWQKIIGSKIRRAVSSQKGLYDLDTSRRNRRKHALRIETKRGARKVIVPGYSEPLPRLEVIRDTSGSMSATDLAIVTREVESIARRIGVRGENLVVTDVDAAEGPSRRFKTRKSIREVTGRGGTDMRVGIAAACERKPTPTAIVVITDGGTPWPTAPPPIPVVAAIVPGPGGFFGGAVEDQVPDFIRAVVVDPAE